MPNPIADLVAEFTVNLAALINAQAMTAARSRVEAALEAGAVGNGVPASVRKRRPEQMCPVPYCRNVAAPVFGMVCGKHKDVAKATIAKYRAARRAKAK